MAIRYSSSFDLTRPFSDTDFQIHLTANTLVTVTIPGTSSQKFTILFGTSSNTNLFVGYNVAATIRAANTATNTQGIEFICPDDARYVIGGDTISLISPDANAYVGISIRSIPN